MTMKFDGWKFEHLGISDLTWGYSGLEVTFHLIDLVSMMIKIPKYDQQLLQKLTQTVNGKIYRSARINCCNGVCKLKFK